MNLPGRPWHSLPVTDNNLISGTNPLQLFLSSCLSDSAREAVLRVYFSLLAICTHNCECLLQGKLPQRPHKLLHISNRYDWVARKPDTSH